VRKLLLILAALALVSPFSALSVRAADEVDDILRHYEAARGGVAAWRAVETLSAKGTYASFSHRKPFTLERRQPFYYHFETESLGGATLWAHDAKGPYWIYPAYATPAWPTRVPPPSDVQLERWSQFEPTLLDAKAKGHRVELLGRGDIDGTKTIELELTLAGGGKETWHLDASTYLEVAIDATIFDYTQTGAAVAERTYPSDFRPVGKLVLPFKVEKEYLARYSLLEFESIELDKGWPAEKFRMPIPAGMETLRPLTGDFDVQVEVPAGRPGQPWQTFQGKATIVPIFEGAVLDETLETDFGGAVETTLRRWSWDRFKEVYRLLQNESTATQPHIYIGKLEDGKLLLDDSTTGSAGLENGQEVLHRFSLEIVSQDEIRTEGERSTDGGKTWEASYRMTYTRKKT